MFKNYLTVAIRNLLRYKAYTLINLSGLAIGMACCVIILLFIQHEYSYNTHHKDSDRIYKVLRKKQGINNAFYTTTTRGPLAAEMTKDIPEVEQGARLLIRPMWLHHKDKTFMHSVCISDPNIFDVFTFPLITGNAETGLNEPYSAFISQRVAQTFFGNDDPIGQIIQVDHKWVKGDFTITGILENPSQTNTWDLSFDFLTTTATPTRFMQTRWNRWRVDNNIHSVHTYVVLREGNSPKTVEDKLPSLAQKHLGAKFVAQNSYHLIPLTRLHLHARYDYGITEYGNVEVVYNIALMGFFILLIACVNFTNLSTARAGNRAREVGIRKVVGAERQQLMGQFLGESTILAILATLISLALVECILPYINTYLQVTLRLNQDIFTGLILLNIFVGILGGLYPALFLSAFHPIEVLKGVFKCGTRNAHLRKGLVVFQFTLSAILITGTIVSTQQITYLHNKDLGFKKDQIVYLLPFAANPELAPSFENIQNAFSQHASIIKASVTNLLPGNANPYNQHAVRLPSQTETQRMFTIGVDHNFLDTYEIPLVKGQDFSSVGASEPVVLINETAAQLFGRDAIVGKNILLSMPREKSYKVIGIVKDFHNRSLFETIGPMILLQIEHTRPYFLSLQIRLDNIPATIEFLKSQWKVYVPTKPFEIQFLDAYYNNRYINITRTTDAIKVLSLLAIFVACLGLFGLIEYTAQQRTKEIGIRKILGATEPHLVVLLSRELISLVFIANLIALPITFYLLNEWLQNFAYRIHLSPIFFCFSILTTLCIASATVGYQALKAARANPIDALRYE